MQVQVLFHYLTCFQFSWIYTRGEIVGSYGISIFNFPRNCHSGFYSSYTVLLSYKITVNFLTISGSLIIVVHPHITHTAAAPSQTFLQSSFCFPALFLSHASLLYPHPGSCELVCLRNPLETSILIVPSVCLGIQVWYDPSASLSSSEPCSPLQVG